MFEVSRTITGNEPITVKDLKEFLRVAYDDNDLLIGRIITAAREMCENYCNRAFIAQTIIYNETLEENAIEFKLPFPNHIEVTKVEVNGEEVDYSTVGLNRLTVILSAFPIILSTQTDVTITYKAVNGFDELAKIGLMNICKQLYENRGDTKMTENGIILMQPYKIYK